MQAIKKLSDIKISQDHKATLQFLTNRLKHRKPEFPAPAFFMLLGAGCSIDAQIPPGRGIISFLQKRCFAQWQLSFKSEEELDIDRIDTLFVSDQVKKKLEIFVLEKQKICHAIVDEKKEDLIKSIPFELQETIMKGNPKKNIWDIVKEEFYNTSYYSFWFDITLPSPRDRQQLIEKIIDRKDPSAAYFLLACAVRNDVFRTFFTTNFDDLINDAILQETGIKSRVYVHNEVVKFINFRSPRPNIIKLHGDYLYQDMKNTLMETSVLQEDQLFKLQEASQDMGAVIIGYSGSDLSIMDALNKIKLLKGADFPLFWCGSNEDHLNWRAKFLINKYENSYFVPTESFDQLAHSIYLDLDCKIRDIKEKTDIVETNHKNATDLIARLNKGVNVPSYLDDKKEKLEDDLTVDEIITNTHKKEKVEDKIAYLSLGINKYPEKEMLYVWRGFFFHDLKMYNEVIKDTNEAIKINPTNAVAHNNRGLAYYNLNNYEQAIINLNQAIKLNPKLASAFCNRGLTNQTLKLYEEAIKDFDKAIEFNPDWFVAYYNRGLCKNVKEEYTEAILDFDKAIDIDPSNAKGYNVRGIAKNHLKMYIGAIEDFDKAIELDPTFSYPYRHKGTALIKLKKLEVAEENIKKAIELDKNYSNAYATLAIIYAIKKETEAFYKNFELALKKDLNFDMFDLLQDEIINTFLKEERFQKLLKKYKKNIG